MLFVGVDDFLFVDLLSRDVQIRLRNVGGDKTSKTAVSRVVPNVLGVASTSPKRARTSGRSSDLYSCRRWSGIIIWLTLNYKPSVTENKSADASMRRPLTLG